MAGVCSLTAQPSVATKGKLIPSVWPRCFISTATCISNRNPGKMSAYVHHETYTSVFVADLFTLEIIQISVNKRMGI